MRSCTCLRTVPLVHAEAPGVFRFHPLLRDFLNGGATAADRERLRAAAARRRAPAARRGRTTAAALDALVQCRRRATSCSRCSSSTASAWSNRTPPKRRPRLDVLEGTSRRPGAVVFALRAVLEAAAGRFPYADHLFRRSLEVCERRSAVPGDHLPARAAADEVERARSARAAGARRSPRWSGCWQRESRTSRWRCACAPRSRSPARCRATRRARRRRCARCWRGSRRRPATTRLRALVHHQASFVALVGGDVRRCRALSSIAVELASRQRPLRAGRARAEHCAPRSRSRSRAATTRACASSSRWLTTPPRRATRILVVEAAFGRYDVLADKGAEEDLDAIEALVERQRLAVETSTAACPTAARCARRGAGTSTRRTGCSSGTAEEQPTPARRFRRWAEIALLRRFLGPARGGRRSAGARKRGGRRREERTRRVRAAPGARQRGRSDRVRGAGPARRRAAFSGALRTAGRAHRARGPRPGLTLREPHAWPPSSATVKSCCAAPRRLREAGLAGLAAA